jgi:hypothetical protein
MAHQLLSLEPSPYNIKFLRIDSLLALKFPAGKLCLLLTLVCKLRFILIDRYGRAQSCILNVMDRLLYLPVHPQTTILVEGLSRVVVRYSTEMAPILILAHRLRFSILLVS